MCLSPIDDSLKIKNIFTWFRVFHAPLSSPNKKAYLTCYWIDWGLSFFCLFAFWENYNATRRWVRVGSTFIVPKETILLYKGKHRKKKIYICRVSIGKVDVVFGYQTSWSIHLICNRAFGFTLQVHLFDNLPALVFFYETSVCFSVHITRITLLFFLLN